MMWDVPGRTGIPYRNAYYPDGDSFFMAASSSHAFFPYENIRNSQRQLVSDIYEAIKGRNHIIAHAPTGLGKTVASLAPALALAEKEDLLVMFLTSRNTQHRIAVETASLIKNKFGLKFAAAGMTGKKWMCCQPGTETMPSSDFSEYCKMLKEEDQCEYYINTRPREMALTPRAKAKLDALGERSPHHTSDFVKECAGEALCPYEMSLSLSAKSRLIVTDYYFAFHPVISENFFSKIDKALDRVVLIVDEGHNLPGRMRELMSSSLTNAMLANARKEADKFNLDALNGTLREIESMIEELAEGVAEDKLVSRSIVSDMLSRIGPLDEMIRDLSEGADEVRQAQKRSSLGSVADFLAEWGGPDEGFVRFVRRNKSRRGQDLVGLYNNCLDPSLSTASVIEKSYSTILMSGTLTPTSMYADLLGFNPKRTVQKEYPSPFDEANKLALIVPKTTTQYSKRSEGQFTQIAKICSEVCESIPGNVAVFFPSYFLRDSVYNHMSSLCKKTMVTEDPGMSASERGLLLEKFKSHRKKGAVLLGVAAGSFGEGIDLPGDLLSGVVVVGLPLSRPDLETNELIKYYDRKFGKGWDYGYVLPAVTKTLQNAGRCIRTETDRGAIVFLDERYAWPQYLKCFPASWNLKITVDYLNEIRGFFGRIPSGSLTDY
ncbi:MAG: ATP-dependent DNA helicase [Nanoarchaeota archaeon]